MPYCCQCGKPVRTSDQFCAVCGARQFNTATPPPVDLVEGLTSRTASVLCYIPYLGWIGSVIILASSKFRYDRVARFHAFQGIYMFVVYLILNVLIHPVLHVLHPPGMPFGFSVSLGNALLLALWIYLLIKTNKGEMIRLPVLGEMADKSVSEQA